MEKKDLQRQLNAVEMVTNSLSMINSTMQAYDIEDPKLTSVIAEFLSAYHLKAANLALDLKNME